MPPLSYHDQKHLTRMFVQEHRVNALFNNLIRNIAPELRKWKDHNNKSVWIRNNEVEKAVERQLLVFKNTLENEIKSNQNNAWSEAVTKNDKFVENYIKGMSLSETIKDGLFSRNLDALTALQNRIDNGFSVSDRVWNITQQTKGHVELFLQTGLSTGRSAEEIGRDVRQLLQNPDKRFRRIRNEKGELVLSKPMKDYHPGRGVYRSSRMNAVRLTATETNMGYRMSDAERWKQLDFVLGFEVRRSPNAHKCDVCDPLVGKYPKDFVFSGWHPFCICMGIPIVMDHDDFADYLLTDEIPKQKFVNQIPANSQKWMDGFMKNNPKNPPLFYKLNKKMYS